MNKRQIFLKQSWALLKESNTNTGLQNTIFEIKDFRSDMTYQTRISW